MYRTRSMKFYWIVEKKPLYLNDKESVLPRHPAVLQQLDRSSFIRAGFCSAT